MREPPIRHATAASIDYLSKRLGYPNDPYMQDWEYEVAESTALPLYLKLYDEMSGDNDIRFTLADMIIQAFEYSDDSLTDNTDWKAFLATIAENIEVHGSQIWYWASWECELKDAWRVAPFMRHLCKIHFEDEA